MDCASIEASLPWLRLSLMPGLSPRMQNLLLGALGSPQAVLAAPADTVRSLLGAHAAEAFARGPLKALVDRARAWLARPDHYLVTLRDARYPEPLRHTADPPLALYVRGHVDALSRPAFAIVGSRNATAQGVRDAHAFARRLSAEGFCIVSGLALGIDAAAHSGGLEGDGGSIAVMGTGADLVYPRGNEALAARLAAKGCLVTEFALGTPPSSENFPRRNRLISGLACGVLVVEAGKPSGSLITARYALEQSREVFAIPGSIHSPVSKGCNALIRDGAKLVESVDDVLEELTGVARARVETPPSAAPSRLLAAMGNGPISLDELARACPMAIDQLGAEITRLELAGRVDALPDGRFQRVGGS